MPNKIPFHQILILSALLSVSLAACTAAPALIPTATLLIETPIPSATATASAIMLFPEKGNINNVAAQIVQLPDEEVKKPSQASSLIQ